MSVSIVEPQVLTVDGQPIVVPSDGDWSVVVEGGLWEGVPAFYPRTKPIVVEMLRFVRAHPGVFSLGLYKHGSHAKTWTAITLFASSEGWRRVHVERVRCGECGAAHATANPTVADLFLGVDLKDRKTMLSFEKERCARCGNSLPRPAIWSELLSGE